MIKIRGTIEELTCVLAQMGDCGMLDVLWDNCATLSVTEGKCLVVVDDLVMCEHYKGFEDFPCPEIVLSG